MYKDELYSRDLLALERTVLANERTFLAYVRTAFGLLLAGFSIINFFNSQQGIISGVIFIAGSCIVLFAGYIRYHVMNKHLLFVNKEREKEYKEIF